ncbi:MAG: peptidyl-prolyl cis-trans isomerase [Gemmatimonadales bacterium]|jgi:hypothetical protein
MKRSLLVLALMTLAAAVLVGCGGETEESAETVPNEETLAARVDDWSITRDYLQDYINSLTDAQKRRFDTHEGRAALAGQMIEEELFYREALDEDLASTDDWVKQQLEEAKRRILIQGYYREHVRTEAEPTEQEIHDYYEAHQDQYTTLAVRRAQHIFSKSKEKLDDIKERIVEGGEKFTTMAHKYSEDKITQADGGDLGFFNPGGYIRGVGFSETFSDTVFQMERGKVYGPIKWEKGYSLVLVNEERPARLRPYAEVRDEIADILARERIENARTTVVQGIIDTGRYDVRNYMNEFYMSIQRSPEELWTYAQNTEDPRERINTFQEIADKFPDDEYAPQALFMVGFVYAEELFDYVTADRKLNEVVQRYPNTEYADMARWMMDNMGDGTPKFEDMSDVNKKMKEDS